MSFITVTILCRTHTFLLFVRLIILYPTQLFFFNNKICDKLIFFKYRLIETVMKVIKSFCVVLM